MCQKRTKVPVYYTGKRPEVAALLPETYTRVLEIGCGEGEFRSNCRADCEYWGVEPVAAAAEVASKTLDKVLVGLYHDVADELPDGYFDLVICCDVIEHMVDDAEFLTIIQKKMKKSGRLLASVPNFRYIRVLLDLLLKKDWKYVDHGVLDRTHLRFYTEKSLRRKLVEHNYSIEKFTGLNPVGQGGIKSKVLGLIAFLFGRDTRFLQFGFRIRSNV